MGTPVEDRTTFPAMLPAEVAIFKAWLVITPKDYDRFDFNVRVGRGLDPGPTFDDSARRNAVLNSQKRIDAVAWKNGQPTIIEVKDRAGASAVGELLTYSVLYRQTFSAQPIPALLLVSNTLQPDIQTVLEFFGIPWVLVTPA